MNVTNIPVGKIYKFDDNRYVMAVMLTETRGGNYRSSIPTRFTEVYGIDGFGRLMRMASGSIVNNPVVFDFNKEFAIRDPDKDEMITFGITVPLEEVDLNDLRMLQSAAQNSQSRKK